MNKSKEVILEKLRTIDGYEPPVTVGTDATLATLATGVTPSKSEIIAKNTISLLFKRYGFDVEAMRKDWGNGLSKLVSCVENDQLIENTIKPFVLEACHTCHTLPRLCHTCRTGFERPTKISKGDIVDFVMETSGWFSNHAVYDAFGAKDSAVKSSVRSAMKRLVESGMVEKNKTKDGFYRKIDVDCEEIDFMSADQDCVNLWLPFGLGGIARILPGNIIVIAGSPNSGKTAFMLNIIKENMDPWECHYFNSEMGPDELKMRLSLFSDLVLSDWQEAKEKGYFTPKARSSCFQDVIVPGKGKLNVIDFMEVHENFWEVGGMIRDIHDRLDGGIAVIALQKPKGRDTGKGGDITLEKPRLALALDEKRCKIVKCKAYSGITNPNQMYCDFDIYQGCELQMTKDWRY